MKVSSVLIDPDRFEEGGWVDEIPEFEGVRLRVRGLGCAKYRKLQNELIDQTPRGRKIGGKLSQADQDRIQERCLLDVVLLDWDGFETDDDQPQPYDREIARLYLTEPKYKKVKDAVVWAASVVAEIKAEDTAAAVGNSPLPPAGS